MHCKAFQPHTTGGTSVAHLLHSTTKEALQLLKQHPPLGFQYTTLQASTQLQTMHQLMQILVQRVYNSGKSYSSEQALPFLSVHTDTQAMHPP